MAKNYGWSKSQVLDELYPDEVDFYASRIRKDSTNDRMTDLAIAQNPHVKDPNKLMKEFQKQMQDVEGKSHLSKEKMTKEDENKLKAIARKMRENSQKRKGA